KGERVGLVGSTGSGKSTTVSLLARLYEFQEGQILIDGKDIRSFDLNYLRSQIGLVSQDAIIFKGSWRDNLVVDSLVSNHDLEELCVRTGLWGILQRNNLTLESEILENGSNLSIG